MEKKASSENLRVVSLTAFLTGLTGSMTRAVWQPFVLSLGASMSTLGLLESLGGPGGLMGSLSQPLGGWFSDRLGRKPLLILGGLSALAGAGFFTLASITENWFWLLPGVLLIGASLVSIPAQRSMVAESSTTDRRGMAYSVLTASAMAPGIFAPALGGFIAERWGYTQFFVIRLGLEALAILLIVRLLQETVGRLRSAVLRGELKRLFATLLVPPRHLRGFFIASAIDMFAWGLGGMLLMGLLSDTYGFTPFQLGVMSSLTALVWTVCQLPVGRLIDRYGCKRSLIFSEGLGLLLIVGWLLARSYAAFLVVEALWGIIGATWVPAIMTLLADSVPENQLGEVMGRYAAFRGVIAFPAPFLGGLLYEQFGFQAPLLANLVGVLITLVLIILAVQDPQREEVGG
jgi:DHA1 family multidrug resistance protein-like MFS transporter